MKIMYIRKITRKWKNKDGSESEKNYFYWYKSTRIGEKVISECLGKASESDYRKLHSERVHEITHYGNEELTKPSITKLSEDWYIERK
jgi:hypothetical protein